MRHTAKQGPIDAEIFDEHGNLRTRCGFASLGLNAELALAMRDAFLQVCGHTSVETRRQAWRCMRKFAVFLCDKGIENNSPLPRDVLVQFRDWLQSQKLNNATRQSQFNVVRSSMIWISANTKGVLSKDSVENVPGFIRDQPRKLANLTQEEVKAILSAAYKEIDEIDSRINVGRRLLASDYKNESERALGDLLQRLLKIGKGKLPKQTVLHRSGENLPKRVSDEGGLRKLSEWVFLRVHDVFLFYLVIAAQCSANPMAILDIRRNCVRPHPLRDDREYVVWSKPRSNREQKADFASNKPHSAPNLIRKLLALNENLLKLVPEAKRDRLFIAYNAHTVGVPCFQLFHVLLDDFIQRNNLPKFDFKQLRKAGGLFHHQVSGSILAAKNRLGHKSSRTTLLYTDRDLFQEENDRLILRFQGELISAAKAFSNTSPETQSENRTIEQSLPAETVFGFQCNDPFSGIAPASRPGALCTNFSHCATCPGAVVTLDDPRVVAKLISTFEMLKKTKATSIETGWYPRFQALYEPTLSIIRDELLPKVDAAVLKIADQTISLDTYPIIE